MRKLFVILVGIVFVGLGVYLLVSGNDMAKRCTAETTGKVVEVIEEVEENHDADGYSVTHTYYPVIEFKAGEETVNKKYSSGTGNRNKYSVGENIDILYDSNKPTDFLIKGDKTSNILGIVFIVAGLVVAVIGVVKSDF